MVGSNTGDGAVEVPRATKPSSSSPGLLRRLGLWTIAFCVGVAALAAVGFLWFIWRVPADEVALDRDADGIVALTGGASRIPDAIELLASGRGKRLLISGVNRATSSKEISRLNPEFERWVRCCVDFDRSLNTLGNAVETRRWAESRGFRSLIVVTSNYHMPRAIVEFTHSMPDVLLIPFPVVGEKWRDEPWWSSGQAARLLVTEYAKFLAAGVRVHIDDWVSPEPASQPIEMSRKRAAGTN